MRSTTKSLATLAGIAVIGFSSPVRGESISAPIQQRLIDDDSRMAQIIKEKMRRQVQSTAQQPLSSKGAATLSGVSHQPTGNESKLHPDYENDDNKPLNPPKIKSIRVVDKDGTTRDIEVDQQNNKPVK